MAARRPLEVIPSERWAKNASSNSRNVRDSSTSTPSSPYRKRPPRTRSAGWDHTGAPGPPRGAGPVLRGRADHARIGEGDVAREVGLRVEQDGPARERPGDAGGRA